MPVSRPLLIALAAAMLALVAFVGSSAMRGGEESSSPAPAQSSAPAPAKPKPAKSVPAAAKPDTAKPTPAEPTAAKPGAAKPARPAAAKGAPARVQSAVERGRTVVLFFFQRGSADDSATAKSVASLRGKRGIAVFTAPVSRLGDFRAVTGSLGISQAPAVVIVGKKGQDRKARVVEGFVDPETLAQEVADSR